MASKKKKSDLNTFLPLILIVLSIIIALVYYSRSSDLLTPQPYTSPFAVDKETSGETAAETVESTGQETEAEESVNTLEIAVPEHMYLMIRDSQGNQTGRDRSGTIVNTIPQSEYLVDETSRTVRPDTLEDEMVHWITINQPLRASYTMQVENAVNGDTIIIYGTNADGEVSTELVDITGDSRTVSLTFDPTSETRSIIVQQ